VLKVTFAGCINVQEFISSWAVCPRMSPACRPCNASISWRIHPEVWAGKRRSCAEVLSSVQHLSGLTVWCYD